MVSDLVRMECLVGPLKHNDFAREANFVRFFQEPANTVVGISSAICDRAAKIRADYGFKPLDALHLATAVDSGCHRFLTNDRRLGRFKDV